ncbi:hypothetical protein AQ490_07190 [Wenjunlia vitaminophila]|uniref:Uncharacterized protein n=1 Tax=Wenjunlia vitaminophila TaxID=76728 RepID=A0A0T6LMF8_WENVI|nr:hypothetical protein [Wenjunlia vitaminophila]KRV47254.1 hypothetical protein AQ490_07190 [Wenjunlia vitaminophila]
MTEIPAVGETVHDTEHDRIGVVMGHVGPHVQLRPIGGGCEWDADPARLTRIPVSTALRDRVAEANSWSRGDWR